MGAWKYNSPIEYVWICLDMFEYVWMLLFSSNLAVENNHFYWENRRWIISVLDCQTRIKNWKIYLYMDYICTHMGVNERNEWNHQPNIITDATVDHICRCASNLGNTPVLATKWYGKLIINHQIWWFWRNHPVDKTQEPANPVLKPDVPSGCRVATVGRMGSSKPNTTSSNINRVVWSKNAKWSSPQCGAPRLWVVLVCSQCQNYRTEPGGQKYGKIPYLCPPPGSDSERSREI